MDIELFLANNRIGNATDVANGDETEVVVMVPHAQLATFLASYGSKQVDEGLFTFHTAYSSSVWTNAVTQYFPMFRDKIWCFGYDWMGRQFALSLDEENRNLILDPATGEVLESPSSLIEFLNEDMVEYKTDTFNVPFFNSLRHLFHGSLPFGKCLGFKIPLFLGGEDELSNYELTDMEVYWNINYQLFSQIEDLPDGTIINDVSIE